MLFDRYSAQFSPEQLDQQDAALRLRSIGDWVLYREDGNPMAIRRLDETRLFYAGIQKSSKISGLSFVCAVISRRGGGCSCDSQVEIETDRFGNILMVKIDSNAGNIKENVTRLYKRNSFDRDWQFCMYQTKERTIGGNESRAVLSKHLRNQIRNRLHNNAHAYPPQRLIQHLASLGEISNRRSANMVVGRSPKCESNAPVLPVFLLHEFMGIATSKQLQHTEMIERLETFTEKCLSVFEENNDLEY